MDHFEISRPAPLPKAGDALPKRGAERKKDKRRKREAERRAPETEVHETGAGESPRHPLDLLT